MAIPVTVFTGFLGAGKTSIILSLLPQLPNDYRVVLLKNEFGEVEVDSQLAKQSNLTAVSEILERMHVLRASRSNEVRTSGDPRCPTEHPISPIHAPLRLQHRKVPSRSNHHRVFVGAHSAAAATPTHPAHSHAHSGSAFPATLAFQIRELERETARALTLDAIVTVIDAENFTGYEDTSVTARMQAQYTDVLLINKWEHVTERALDDVLEHLNTLNELTPKIRCADSSSATVLRPRPRPGRRRLMLPTVLSFVARHHDEVETVTLLRGVPAPPVHVHTDACNHCHPHPQDHTAIPRDTDAPLAPLDEPALAAALGQLPKESVYRVKGFLRFSSVRPHAAEGGEEEEPEGQQILNWAFGRWELVRVPASSPEENGELVRLTVMGERGEVRRYAKKLAESLGAKVIA
ncbi:cobW-domain-containing protein [Lactarius psammicola]|nr:cobW-domain-containing protein [Lactarius psammicola]